MRNAVNQASNATTTAANTGTQLGTEAQGIGSTLTPFLTSELAHPQGFGQQGESAMLSAAEGGAGGATSGVMGEANQEAARSRNAGGYQAVLDDAARSRAKAAAGASEGIAGQNAELQSQQQQDAAKGLAGQYGTDTSGMLDATGQEAKDIEAGVDANKTGWLQDAQGALGMAGSAASLAGGFGIPGFSGFKK